MALNAGEHFVIVSATAAWWLGISLKNHLEVI